MCYISLKAIALACKGNYLKGMKAFSFVEAIDRVASIPAPATSRDLKVAGNITFKAAVVGDTTVTPAIEAQPAGQFYKWMTSKVEGSYKSEQQGDEDTPSWKITYETFIPGLTEAVAATLDETVGHELIVIACDKGGNNRILGEIGNGCTLKFTEQTADKPGFKLVFTWECNHLPYFYTGALTA